MLFTRYFAGNKYGRIFEIIEMVATSNIRM